MADVFSRLSSSDKGSTGAEARARVEKYGSNEISEKKVSPVLKFLVHF